jgi:hypothetical protein
VHAFLILQAVMFEDLVQRRQALDVLMSYNPFWLHIAVEVVTQKAFKPDGKLLLLLLIIIIIIKLRTQAIAAVIEQGCCQCTSASAATALAESCLYCYS